jgi:hypothetical protein
MSSPNNNISGIRRKPVQNSSNAVPLQILNQTGSQLGLTSQQLDRPAFTQQDLQSQQTFIPPATPESLPVQQNLQNSSHVSSYVSNSQFDLNAQQNLQNLHNYFQIPITQSVNPQHSQVTIQQNQIVPLSNNSHASNQPQSYTLVSQPYPVYQQTPYQPAQNRSWANPSSLLMGTMVTGQVASLVPTAVDTVQMLDPSQNAGQLAPTDPIADPASLQNSTFPATMPSDNPVQSNPDATTLSPTPDPYTEASSFQVPFLGGDALQDPYSDPATQASATWTADFGDTGDSYVAGAMTTDPSGAFAPGTGGFGAGEATPDDCGSQGGSDVIVGDDGGDDGDSDGDEDDSGGD